MFEKIWNLILRRKINLGVETLGAANYETDYLLHVGRILEAEANLRVGNFQKAFRIANASLAFFHDYDKNRTFDEFSHDSTGFKVAFLEACVLNWILARALAGLMSWHESYAAAKQALKAWDFYRLARLPFQKISEEENRWRTLPEEIKAHLEFLRNIIKPDLTKKEWLDLLVPENFIPKQFTTKTNRLSGKNPLVSVLIASYRDEEWLQITIDAVLKNAGYANFEIVVVLQRGPDDESDSTGRFLEEEPYRSNPKIQVIRFNEPLAADRAKTIGFKHCSGELIISLDAHVIPSKNFMGKTVEIFLENPEVSLLGYGIVDADEDQTLRGYYFNEVPYLIHGAFGFKDIREKPEMLIPYKPGLYIRHCLMGAAFCMTAALFEEIGGYLLNDRSWGDKTLGISAYLYGYQIFVASEIICIHRGHLRSLYHQKTWTETFKIREDGYALEECGLSSLIIGYHYFSETYFHEYYIAKIKEYSGESFKEHWRVFQEMLPSLTERKAKFWENAVRTMREYWLEYGDYIWRKLEEDQKKQLYTYFNPQKKASLAGKKGIKIYVSLTTIPSRIGNIKNCILSLLNQTVKPDKIFINIPYAYKRFSAQADIGAIPDFGESVQIVRCEDYGPGTKLLGCKDLLEKDSLLILVDDDLIYKDYMIETLAKNFLIDPASSFSFHTYRIAEVTVGQGADGFAISTNVFDKLDAFYDFIKKDEFLFFQDDAWISLYLHFKNCSPVSLRHRLRQNDRDIYTIYNDSDALYYLTDEYSRLNLNNYCLNYFRANLQEIRSKIF